MILSRNLRGTMGALLRVNLTVGVTAGVLLGALREASAQGIADSHCPNLVGEKNGGLDWLQPPIRNTVGYRTMTNALLSNAQAYGAVSMAERRLLPILASNDKNVTFDLDTTFTFGAVRLPLCPLDHKSDTPIMGSVDLSVVNLGIGARYGFFGVFLASSVASHTVYTDPSAFKEGVGRGTVAITLPMMAIAYFPVGLIKSEYYRENLSVVYTHVVGGAFFTPVGPITAGYATTRGFFTNFTGSKIPLFASALLASKLEEVPYLSAGLASIAAFNGGKGVPNLGDTALFARRLQYIGLAPSNVSTRDLGADAVKRTPFVTEHLEQTGIAEIFDLTIVATSAPQPNLYEATVGVHTPGYRSPRRLLAQAASGSGDKKDNGAGFSASAGVVRLPDLWFYGVQGGYRFKASVNYAGALGGAGLISFGLAFNDTEILSVFPYAYNAPQISALIAGTLDSK